LNDISFIKRKHSVSGYIGPCCPPWPAGRKVDFISVFMFVFHDSPADVDP